MLQILVVGFMSFLPLLVYSLWAGEDGSLLVVNLLLALGIIYFPMAMLAVIVLGYTGALGPQIVLPALFRGGWEYWLGVVMLFLLYFVGYVLGEFLSGYLIINSLVMSLVGAYILMTNARILGVVYRERQDELGWF